MATTPANFSAAVKELLNRSMLTYAPGAVTEHLKAHNVSYNADRVTTLFDTAGIAVLVKSASETGPWVISLQVLVPHLQVLLVTARIKEHVITAQPFELVRVRVSKEMKLRTKSAEIISLARVLSERRLTGWRILPLSPGYPWSKTQGLFEELRYLGGIGLVHPHEQVTYGRMKASAVKKPGGTRPLAKMLKNLPKQALEQGTDEKANSVLSALAERGRTEEQQAHIRALIQTRPDLGGTAIGEAVAQIKSSVEAG